MRRMVVKRGQSSPRPATLNRNYVVGAMRDKRGDAKNAERRGVFLHPQYSLDSDLKKSDFIRRFSAPSASPRLSVPILTAWIRLRACLKKERGCVKDQPQHAMTNSKPMKFTICCGWSRTTQPQSRVFRQALTFTCVSRRLRGSRGSGAPLPAHRVRHPAAGSRRTTRR